MKKLNVLFALFFAFTLLFTSCNGDDEEATAPVLSLNQTEVTKKVSEDFTFELSITSNVDLESIKVIPTPAGKEGSTLLEQANVIELTDANNAEFEKDQLTATILYKYIVKDDQAPGEITLTFEVKNDGMSNSIIAKIMVEEPVKPVTTKSISMNAQPNGPNSAASNKCFANLVTGDTYTFNEMGANKENIDIAFLRNANIKKTTYDDFGLLSPNNDEIATQLYANGSFTYPASSMRNTKITKIDNVSDWANLDASALSSATDALGSGSTPKVMDINVDDIFAFETADNQKGLIKIISQDPGGSSYTDANMSIEVKYIAE